MMIPVSLAQYRPTSPATAAATAHMPLNRMVWPAGKWATVKPVRTPTAKPSHKASRTHGPSMHTSW